MVMNAAIEPHRVPTAASAAAASPATSPAAAPAATSPFDERNRTASVAKRTFRSKYLLSFKCRRPTGKRKKISGELHVAWRQLISRGGSTWQFSAPWRALQVCTDDIDLSSHILRPQQRSAGQMRSERVRPWTLILGSPELDESNGPSPAAVRAGVATAGRDRPRRARTATSSLRRPSGWWAARPLSSIHHRCLS